jgi:flagellar hook-associated protein 2
MATITSLGVGSGLDLNTIVTQLVALEKKPLQQMQSAASDLSSKVSIYGRISSLFSSLQDASNKLTDPTLWQSTKVSSSDANTVSVTAGSGAAAGNYAVSVQALAGNQTVAANTALAAATDLVGAGTLTLETGSWNADQSAFTAKSGGTPLAISVSDTDTLQSLRDKINSAGAGVTASLVSDANGVRLTLRSNDSGAANGFRLAVSDTDGVTSDDAGLSRFAFDPAAGVSGMALKQAAANAAATVNGIPVESATNDITGAIDGLTFTLRAKTTGTPVSLSATRDKDTVVATIKSFADAYNALAGFLSTQTKYDATSKTGGPLQGEAAANSLQSQLRNLLNNSSGASSVFSRLSDIGLQSQRDGTLVVSDTKLSAAANNLTELKKAFANSDSTVAGNNGFARRYATLASQVLGTDGTVTIRTQGLQKAITRNSDDQAKLNDRVDLFQQRLVAQYTQLDSNVAKLNSLSSYVTQQIAQMNKTSN